MKTLLIIGLNLPEPTTTAAGSRMLQLISLFQEQGFQIVFSSTTKPSERSYHLDELGIESKQIEINHSSFDVFVKDLNPDIVLFDRFIIEEQFGWRVTENCPNAMKILDTEYLHFLRKAREEAVKKGNQVEEVDIFTETTKREIASIYRCDLSLIISEFEMKLLQDAFGIKKELLFYIPFLFRNQNLYGITSLPKFEERKDFVTVGNHLHAPNVDSVKYLKKEIWPHIRKEIPEVQMKVYGEYTTKQLQQLHDVKSGFIMMGWTDNVDHVMKTSRVCLAPLRFGAGLKGKIFDAMRNGTPSVTTYIGSEGINDSMPFSGLITTTSEEFANASIELYNNKSLWVSSQQNGCNILENRFKLELFADSFEKEIENIHGDLNEHRKKNFIGQILQHHSLKSTMYLSKWIEEKNK